MAPFSIYLLLLTVLPQAEAPAARHDFDLDAIARAQPELCAMGKSEVLGEECLRFSPKQAGEALELFAPRTPWDGGGYNYLVCEVWHDDDASAILWLDFHPLDANDGVARRPRIWAKIGVLPGLRTQVVFPLSFLDGQRVFLPRFPRQLKGTVGGHRLAPEELGSLRLRSETAAALTIARACFSDEVPPPLADADRPYVDPLGQWARKEWPGKIADEDELRTRLLALEAEAEAEEYPDGWSRYGGWKEKQFEATGFFRTQHDGERWWLVDPEGYAHLSFGMDCLGAGASGRVRGQEDLFAWIPTRDDAQFRDALAGDSVHFLRANLIRVFGAEWNARWRALTANLLRRAGFNTVGNWSDLAFARGAEIPYVLPLSRFPTTKAPLYRDFPDVFAAEYAEASTRYAQQLEPFRDDPWLIGYFLANEPHWAFGRNNLAFEMFATDSGSATKQECVRWLEERYGGDLARFNTEWHGSWADFSAVGDAVLATMPSAAAETDLWEFSGVMVRRYVDVVCDAVEAVDPHHLNLGLRYAWISSDLLYRAGERFDVFSINGYSLPAPPDTAEIAQRSGKPILIGEFHFGAVDRGLPATGIQGVVDQAARGIAYRHYVEHGFARPELIGIHYFQWNDQVITGRFDGENYNIGFLDVCHQPYQELFDAARATHSRIYRVATGELAPFAEKPASAPRIFY